MCLPTSPPGGWVLDLDDLGPEIREPKGAPGAGAVLLDGDDADIS